MKILPPTATLRAPGGTFTGEAWFDVIAHGDGPSRLPDGSLTAAGATVHLGPADPGSGG